MTVKSSKAYCNKGKHIIKGISMKKVIDKLELIENAESTVLIHGETGIEVAYL